MYTLATCVFPLQLSLLVVVGVAKAAHDNGGTGSKGTGSLVVESSEKTIPVSRTAAYNEGQTLQDEMENELNEIDSKFGQTSALSEDELFKDMFPITSDNFTEKVLNRKDAWIVVFHDGKTTRNWMNMARDLRGIAWVGMIEQTAGMKLLNNMNVTTTGIPGAVVFPYGYADWKKKQAKAVTTPMAAKEIAVASLPDFTQKLSASSLNDFLMACYMPSPSKFPAIFLTTEPQVPPAIKALAIHFDEYFHFGVLSNPSSVDLEALGLTNQYLDLPVFFILINTEMTAAQTSPATSAAMFDKNTTGGMNYTNMLKFLFATNTMYRHLLLGDNGSDKEKVAMMSDVLAMHEERFDIKLMREDTQRSADRQEL